MTSFRIVVEYSHMLFPGPFTVPTLYEQLEGVERIVRNGERVDLDKPTLTDRIAFSLSSETEGIPGSRGVDALWALIDRLDAFLAGRWRVPANSEFRQLGPMSFRETAEGEYIQLPSSLARL